MLFVVFFQAICVSPVGTSKPGTGKGCFLTNPGAGSGRSLSCIWSMECIWQERKR